MMDPGNNGGNLDTADPTTNSIPDDVSEHRLLLKAAIGVTQMA